MDAIVFGINLRMYRRDASGRAGREVGVAFRRGGLGREANFEVLDPAA
jgi:hypothetical protein